MMTSYRYTVINTVGKRVASGIVYSSSVRGATTKAKRAYPAHSQYDVFIIETC